MTDEKEIERFRESLVLKRKKFEKNEPSDGSDVDSSSDGSRAEDSEDEVRLCKPGGYHAAKEGDKLFNKYNLITKLGRGHFSTVWKGVEMANGNEVAIKIQKSAKSYRGSAMEEIEVHKYLSRKNGNKYLNLMLYNNTLKAENGMHVCMVFPLMDMDLAKYAENFEDEKIPLNRTSEIAYQLLSGTAFFHTRGVIHTDIKPENIVMKVIDDKVSVQIADFGTACIVGDRENDYLQTSHYRSPEIILSYKQWGCPIDIWSLACVFFECLTGQYLFDGENEFDLFVSMIETLGQPRTSFLRECKSRRTYFGKDGNMNIGLMTNMSPLPLHRVLMEEVGFDRHDSDAISKLLLPMLEYDPGNRWTAQQLLALFPSSEVENEEVIQL